MSDLFGAGEGIDVNSGGGGFSFSGSFDPGSLPDIFGSNGFDSTQFELTGLYGSSDKSQFGNRGKIGIGAFNDPYKLLNDAIDHNRKDSAGNWVDTDGNIIADKGINLESGKFAYDPAKGEFAPVSEDTKIVNSANNPISEDGKVFYPSGVDTSIPGITVTADGAGKFDPAMPFNNGQFMQVSENTFLDKAGNFFDRAENGAMRKIDSLTTEFKDAPANTSFKWLTGIDVANREASIGGVVGMGLPLIGSLAVKMLSWVGIDPKLKFGSTGDNKVDPNNYDPSDSNHDGVTISPVLGKDGAVETVVVNSGGRSFQMTGDEYNYFGKDFDWVGMIAGNPDKLGPNDTAVDGSTKPGDTKNTGNTGSKPPDGDPNHPNYTDKDGRSWTWTDGNYVEVNTVQTHGGGGIFVPPLNTDTTVINTDGGPPITNDNKNGLDTKTTTTDTGTDSTQQTAGGTDTSTKTDTTFKPVAQLPFSFYEMPHFDLLSNDFGGSVKNGVFSLPGQATETKPDESGGASGAPKANTTGKAA